MYSYHLVMDWVLTGQSLSLEMFRNWFLKKSTKKSAKLGISILPKSQIFGWNFGRVLGLVLGQALGNG